MRTIMKGEELYNLMNDGQLSPFKFDPTLLMLIDLRDEESFRVGHIVTALPQWRDEPKDVDSFSHIIMYADLDVSKQEQSKLTQKYKACEHVAFLDEGFLPFKEKFPFLCTDKFDLSGKERHELLTEYPSIILSDFLYLGTGEQSVSPKIVQDLKITHIINFTQEYDCPHAHCKYLHFPFPDYETTNLIRLFPKTNAFIREARQKNGIVFVHCTLGRSRSASIVIAYLMLENNWSLKQSLEFVTSKRPIVEPNDGFMRQLKEWEGTLS